MKKLLIPLLILCLLTACAKTHEIDPGSMAGLIGDREGIETLAYDAVSSGNIHGWVELPGQEGAAVLDLLYAIDTARFAPAEGSFLGGSAELRFTAGYGTRQLTLVNTTEAQYLVLRTEENQILQYKGPAASYDFVALRELLQAAAQVTDDPERCAVASVPGRSDTVTLSRRNTALATAIMDAVLSTESSEIGSYDLELRLGDIQWQLDSTTGACARQQGDTTLRGVLSDTDLMTLRMRCGLGSLLS